ncbi:Endonuclease domain-containing 1 protein [Anabarilius grahami]|uniref:Endonuclease domain-containing 1 protein n=1 Tax=Anabarilius grahami TaxID=495550 RepID=A0A3N0XGM5_ANAGA|nr:Endonuclease domain-containing 1 protein [Anabarilius grahami]
MFVLALLTCIMLRAFSAQAKVVPSFKECEEFFFKNKEPEGMDQNTIKICQMYKEGESTHSYYATLYSVHDRIPIYSAYRFDYACIKAVGRTNIWHIEPQISQSENQHEYMVRETQNNKNTYKSNQATSSDYSDTGYDRGHLNPNSFQYSNGRKATFTLTNAAPMNPCFNQKHWNKWERTLRSFLVNTAFRAKVYIVTGTVPNANIRIPQRESSEDPERVTVPSHIWTAVCFEHQDSTESFSFGFIGQNQLEGGISLMNISELNNQLSRLYSQHSSSSIQIFDDDCFAHNNKFSKVQAWFNELINLPENQKEQMSSGIQNTHRAVIMTIGSSFEMKKVKVTEMRVKLNFDSLSTYNTVTEELKMFAGSACLITNVKSLVRNQDELRKRDVSKVSDAVECLLVSEKQRTAADGSPCSSVSEFSDICICKSGGKTKLCCSTPCLYQHKLKGYRCYSGERQTECSPRYSLITIKGEKCLEDHPCATYGYDYYWCKTEHGYIKDNWGYCSPPLWRSKAENGKYCHSNHACAKYGKSQPWCYTDDGKKNKCCISDDCYSAVNGKTCRSDHPCGYHDYSYLWCYTDYKDNWDYCCTNC